VECDRLLILSGPLCLLYSKLGKLNLRKIMDIMSYMKLPQRRCDYSMILMRLIWLTFLDVILARRNSGDVRDKEIDDITEAVSLLDENKLLVQLPRYVIDNT